MDHSALRSRSKAHPLATAWLLLACAASSSHAQAPSLVPTAPSATPTQLPRKHESAVKALPPALQPTLPGNPSSLVADRDGRIRTQLSPRNAVTLSSELAARIEALPLREGESFRAGQPIASFDCSLYKAQQRKAEASTEAAQALVQSNQRLADLNSIGKSELAQAQARLKEAQADASGAAALVSRCEIAAPYSGRVVKRHAAQHQYVTPGTPLLDIVETGQLEVQMIVPSKWLAWLKPGAALTVEVEELGKSYQAKVLRLGALIDPVSQSVLAIGVIDGNQPALVPGMSGWAIFPGAKPERQQASR